MVELIKGMTGGTLQFTFGEAYRRSHMRMLGDALIATEYPLALRLEVTSKIMRQQRGKSHQNVRIEAARLFVAGKPIRSKRDKKIAFGFMRFGQWEEAEHVTMDGERIAAIEYAFSPVESDKTQSFAFVGSLSGLASLQFNHLTADAGLVKAIRPRDLPIAALPNCRREIPW